MSYRTQRLCAWCGVISTIFWLVGYWPLAGFLVPPSPLLGPEEIAEIFRNNTNQIRIGLIILGFGSVFYIPYTAAISQQMKRIEGKNSPLTYTQLGAGSIFVWVFFIPVMVWLAAAFRPHETPAEVIRYMHDFAWLTFLNPVAIIFIQGIAICLAILQDKRSNPILPRWLGYLNIWLVIIYLPGGLIPIFKSGPFAWNGLLAYWIPLSLFCPWMLIMPYYLIKAINREEAEAV